MTKHQKQTTNDKLAPKLVIHSLKAIPRLLGLVGKPVYLLFTYLVLFIAFILYITGYFTRTILTNLLKYIISLIYTLGISLPFTIYSGVAKQQIKVVKQLKKTGVRKQEAKRERKEIKFDLGNIKPYLKKVRLTIFQISNFINAIKESIASILQNLRRSIFPFRKIFVLAISLTIKLAVLIFKIADFLIVTTLKLVLLPFKLLIH